MKSLFLNTAGDRIGAVDGLNLFFGALLGANLGTIDRLPIREYVTLIVFLAGTVMTLRMISTTERRVAMFIVLAFYALLLVGMVTLPSLHPRGMSADDVQRLVATLGVWILCVLGAELTPMRKQETPASTAPDPS
jgi:hypothetical protein